MDEMSTPSAPIEVFVTDGQIDRCLSYWKNLLCLNDWYIKVMVVPSSQFKLQNCAGENEFNTEGRSAIIRLIGEEEYGSRVVKMCHEGTLVHELLHLCLPDVGDTETFEGKVTQNLQHQTLEKLARALVCAKYGLTPDWFWNTKV
jgi:hypothetical protein